MAQGVLPDIPFYFLPTKNCFVAAGDAYVRFDNFGVGKAVPLKEHVNFISNFLVPHYIKTLEALNDPNHNTLTVPGIGQASATGDVNKNKALSDSRVRAIGEVVKREFDKLKTRSAIASSCRVEIDSQAWGETESLKVRDGAEQKFHTKFTDQQVEAAQGNYRSVMMAINAYDKIDPDDSLYQCRELYEVDFKVEKVPANLLEQTIDDIDKKLGTIGKLAGLGVWKGVLWRIQKVYKYQIKNLLKNAGRLIEDIPEIKIMMEVIDFVIPSDISLLFEFKDNKDKRAVYAYSGSTNKKDTSDALKMLMYVLGIRRYLQKAETALKAALTSPRCAPFRPEIQAALMEVISIEAQFDSTLASLTGRGGVVRKYLGDAVTDFLLALMRKDPPAKARIPVSPWSVPFPMTDKKYYDVKSFGGPARTLIWDVLFKSHISLEFAGRDEHGYLGYGGSTEVVSDISAQNQALAFGVSNGRLLHT